MLRPKVRGPGLPGLSGLPKVRRHRFDGSGGTATRWERDESVLGVPRPPGVAGRPEVIPRAVPTDSGGCVGIPPATSEASDTVEERGSPAERGVDDSGGPRGVKRGESLVSRAAGPIPWGFPSLRANREEGATPVPWVPHGARVSHRTKAPGPGPLGTHPGRLRLQRGRYPRPGGGLRTGPRNRPRSASEPWFSRVEFTPDSPRGALRD